MSGATFTFSPGNTTTNPLVTSTAGTYTVVATLNGSSSAASNQVVLTPCPQTGDLTVSTGTLANPTVIPVGNYNNVTITGTGNAILGANITVSGRLQVQTGGSLASSSYEVTGSGSVEVQDGTTILVGYGFGLSRSSGVFRPTGTHTYSSDASYVFNGTIAQRTGDGLPTRTRNLTVDNPVQLTLTRPVAVARMLTIANSGNLLLNGNQLTLLADASGTAMVVNSGTGVVSGSTVAVQRYLDPSQTPGLGYRHYSSPVQATTVADLATSGFTPVVNPAYNTQGNTVAPFPTVFGYDESRLTGASALTQDFDYGFVSPSSLNDNLVRGRGYTVNLPASEKVDLVGALNNGDVTVGPLSRGSQLASGWQLLGNPYPAPLDWSVARGSLPTGMRDAVYVYKPASQYGGSYLVYQNGFGTLAGGLIGSMQGFFVQATLPVASLTFRNAWRAQTYQSPTSYRPATDLRPALQLDLVSPQGVHDPAFIYFEAGATAGVDDHYDAEKLPNTTGLNLSSVAAGTRLAINGLPPVGAPTTVPLVVGVPAAGTYTLQAASLANLGTAPVLLLDAATGQQINLQQQPSYTFTTSGGVLLTGRFSVEFAAQMPLASAGGLTAASVAVYPNPASNEFTLRVPAVPGATRATAELVNVLGQRVRTCVLTLPAGGAQTTVSVLGLPAGVYTLRVQAGEHTVAKKVVVE